MISKLRFIQASAATGFAITKEDILLILNIVVLVIGLIIDYLNSKEKNKNGI